MAADLEFAQIVMALMTTEDHERAERFRNILGINNAAICGSNFQLLIEAWGVERTVAEVTTMIRVLDKILIALKQKKPKEQFS